MLMDKCNCITTSADRPDLTASYILPLSILSTSSVSGCGEMVDVGGSLGVAELKLLPALHLRRF